MSIWRNCRTAVIFKSIVPPHTTCELKRMCFPKDIQCLMLSCWFLGHSWNFLSVASWLIRNQQFCGGTGDAEYWKLSEWVCEDTLRLTALHTIQEKEFLTHWKDPACLSVVLLFFSSCWLQGPRARLQGLSQRVCPAYDSFSKSGRVEEGLQIFSRGIFVSGGDFFCLYTVVPVQKSSDRIYMSC